MTILSRETTALTIISNNSIKNYSHNDDKDNNNNSNSNNKRKKEK